MKKQVETSTTKQPTVKSRIPENIMDEEGHQGVDAMNAGEALAALQEIKVLSQQIVKLHDKNNDASTSDSSEL